MLGVGSAFTVLTIIEDSLTANNTHCHAVSKPRFGNSNEVQFTFVAFHRRCLQSSNVTDSACNSGCANNEILQEAWKGCNS